VFPSVDLDYEFNLPTFENEIRFVNKCSGDYQIDKFDLQKEYALSYGVYILGKNGGSIYSTFEGIYLNELVKISHLKEFWLNSHPKEDF
jgi:hypothetical protein